MPSKAFGAFKYNIVDTQRIIETFRLMKKPGAGQGHLTRGDVVLLCASWELYVEDVLEESTSIYTSQHASPVHLPMPVQKELSKAVKLDKNELRPLDIAGDGWKAFYALHVKAKTANLNTPKSNTLAPLFSDLLGVEDISKAWSLTANELDDFVRARGEIAHKGRHAERVGITELKTYLENTYKFAVETDNFLSDHLRDTTPNGYKPWNKNFLICWCLF